MKNQKLMETLIRLENEIITAKLAIREKPDHNACYNLNTPQQTLSDLIKLLEQGTGIKLERQ